MQVTLDPELEQKLQRKIESGEFESADAAMNEALRRLLEPAQDPDDPLPLEEMRQLIAETEADIANGAYTRYSAETLENRFEEIKAEGRKRLEAAQKASSHAV